MTQLRELAEPFPDRYVHSNPSGGGSYVKHHVIVQRLLSIVGPFTFTVDEFFYSDVRDRSGTVKLDRALVGCRATLTVTVDGREVSVTEVGDCELPTNWLHDGARAKDAASDAIKRCAARLGLGLHLWSGPEYFLPGVLDKRPDADGVVTGEADDEPAPSPSTPTPQPAEDDGPKLARNGEPVVPENVRRNLKRLQKEHTIDEGIWRTLLSRWQVTSSTELSAGQGRAFVAVLEDPDRRLAALQWAEQQLQKASA